MTIQSCISELQNLGYHLYLDGGQLRYKCLSLIEPPKDKVLPLMEVIKRNRDAVIGYLKPKNTFIPFDTLKTLYMDAFNRIGWKIGLMARPEVTQAEDMLNEVWLNCMEGKAGLEDFNKALSKWEGVIREVVMM